MSFSFDTLIKYIALNLRCSLYIYCLSFSWLLLVSKLHVKYLKDGWIMSRITRVSSNECWISMVQALHRWTPFRVVSLCSTRRLLPCIVMITIWSSQVHQFSGHFIFITGWSGRLGHRLRVENWRNFFLIPHWTNLIQVLFFLNCIALISKKSGGFFIKIFQCFIIMRNDQKWEMRKVSKGCLNMMSPWVTYCHQVFFSSRCKMDKCLSV